MRNKSTACELLLGVIALILVLIFILFLKYHNTLDPKEYLVYDQEEKLVDTCLEMRFIHGQQIVSKCHNAFSKEINELYTVKEKKYNDGKEKNINIIG